MSILSDIADALAYNVEFPLWMVLLMIVTAGPITTAGAWMYRRLFARESPR